MKAINLLTKKEYEVHAGKDVDDNFDLEYVIDFDTDNWFVLERYQYKSIQKGHEYLTYDVEGILYQGYFTPKHSEILSLAIVIEKIKEEIPYIPHEFLKIVNAGTRNEIQIIKNNTRISISVFFMFDNDLKTDYYPRHIKTYGYSILHKQSGSSGGGCSLDNIIKYLKRDLELINIKPIDKQISIFDL